MRIISNERGISLIEVVASLVIITIIFLAFFNFFIQSKKTNVASEAIHDATYHAQKAMEQIYITSTKSGSLQYLSTSSLPGTTFTKIASDVNNNCVGDDLNKVEMIYRYSSDLATDPYQTDLMISKLCNYTNATKVLIEVYEKNTSNKRAIVENVYIWKP